MSKRKFCMIAARLTPLLLWYVIAVVPAHSQDEAAWSIDAQGNLTIHAERVTHEPVFIPPAGGWTTHGNSRCTG